MYKHAKCGGLVNRRKCRKCGKRWGPVSFLFTTELRPEGVEERKRRLACAKDDDNKKKTWIEKRFPSSETVASLLPQWPRWARILFSLSVVTLIGLGIWWWRS